MSVSNLRRGMLQASGRVTNTYCLELVGLCAVLVAALVVLAKRRN